MAARMSTISPRVRSAASSAGSISGRPGTRSRTRREDLDALDRVDAEVGLELHVQREHLDRVAGLLGHDVEHQRESSVSLPPAGARRHREHFRRGRAAPRAAGAGAGTAGGRCRSAAADRVATAAMVRSGAAPPARSPATGSRSRGPTRTGAADRRWRRIGLEAMRADRRRVAASGHAVASGGPVTGAAGAAPASSRGTAPPARACTPAASGAASELHRPAGRPGGAGTSAGW